jgi:type I restriction enzyme S subunit
MNKQFKDIVTLHRGFDLPANERKTGNVPLFSSNGLTDWISKSKVHGPGVITGRSGTIGNVFYTESDFWPLNTTLYVSDFHNNNEKYISYWLSTLHLSSYSGGASVPTLNRNELSELVCSIHGIDDQRHIVDTIGSIDDLIDKNNKEIDAITNWCASFFKTKIIGKSEDVPLSKACIFENGYSYSGSELKPSATGMVTIKSFERTGGFKADGIKAIAPSKNIKKCKQCDVGDILVAHTDLTKNQEIIGAPVLITTLGDFSSLIFSMDLVKVIPSSNLYGSVIIYQSLLASAFQKYSLGFCSGTTVVHLNKRALNTFVVSLPKVDAIDAIRKPLESGQSLIVKLTQENNWLQKEKETLLDKYFGSR